jgi:hypothetical protein
MSSEPKTQTPSGPSIPINHYLAAAKDAELKLLLRRKATAVRRIERAQADAVQVDGEIADYIANTYPDPSAPEPT